MPLTELAPGVHFFASAVNSGVIEDGQGGALIVDTGLDDSHARKLLSGLAERQLTPTAILNTHSHADHHGGNALVLKRFPGLPIYAPPLEAAIINHPLLEPLSLFGACPPPALQDKFFLAPATPAQAVSAGKHTLGGAKVELLDIPGHAVQMFAVRVGGVLLAADGLFGPASLKKNPLTFCADSAAQKASAARLGALEEVQITLPGHGDPTTDLAGLARTNLEAYEGTTGAVWQAIQAGPLGIDDLLAVVCAARGIEMTRLGALLLNRSVISAHVTELCAAGRASLEMVDNRLKVCPVA